MNVIWRFLLVILFSRFSQPVALMKECRISFRVLPTDIDVLLHMNNGRYFSLTDLARIHFMIRNKSFSILKKHKTYGVVASEMIRFKKSINLFQRFDITTKLIGWDDKFFYVSHYFECNQQLCALSLVKICFLKAGRRRRTKEMIALLGIQQDPLELPPWVKNWQQADQAFYEEALKSYSNSSNASPSR